MNRYAIIINGVVDNVILLNDLVDWTAPENSTIVADEEAKAEIGGTWSRDTGFIAPAIPVISREEHAAWFKAALLEMGQLDRIDTFVAALPPTKKLLWEYATSFKEDDTDVIGVAGALSIDLKVVFDTAATIRKSKFGG